MIFLLSFFFNLSNVRGLVLISPERIKHTNKGNNNDDEYKDVFCFQNDEVLRCLGV